MVVWLMRWCSTIIEIPTPGGSTPLDHPPGQLKSMPSKAVDAGCHQPNKLNFHHEILISRSLELWSPISGCTWWIYVNIHEVHFECLLNATSAFLQANITNINTERPFIPVPKKEVSVPFPVKTTVKFDSQADAWVARMNAEANAKADRGRLFTVPFGQPFSVFPQRFVPCECRAERLHINSTVPSCLMTHDETLHPARGKKMQRCGDEDLTAYIPYDQTWQPCRDCHLKTASKRMSQKLPLNSC